MNTLTTELVPCPPFDFDLTASYRTRYSIDLGSERFSEGVYRRLCRAGKKLALMTLASHGTLDAPRLRLEARGSDLTPEDLPKLSWQASWLLGLDYDLAGFYSMAQEDPVLSGLTRRFPGLKPPREPDIFETLVTAIIGQQISGRVAVVIQRALITAYGSSQMWQGLKYHTFPTPESLAQVGVSGLRQCKLSQRKAEYIDTISKAVAGGVLDLEELREMEDDRAIDILTRHRGIGIWTAQWVLCDALGRFDVFPASDLALLRTVSRVYMDGRAVTPEEAEAFADRWGIYKVPVITYLYAAIRQRIDLAASSA